jgi:hypothetical protein
VWPAAGFVDTEKGSLTKLEVGRARRVFSREFKVEAVRLVREQGVSVAQASRDVDVHEMRFRSSDFAAPLRQYRFHRRAGHAD